MDKNLNVTTFRNGDTILYAPSQEAWDAAGDWKVPAWTYYKSDSIFGATFGKLYNWYAVTDKRGLSPYGWHIPNNQEWEELSTFLNGNDIAGLKLKAKTGLGYSDNSTNSSGFTAQLGGYRYKNGDFYGMMSDTYFWSSEEFNDEDAFCRGVSLNEDEFSFYDFPKKSGFYVRCIKDDTTSNYTNVSAFVSKGLSSSDSTALFANKSRDFFNGSFLENTGFGVRAGYCTLTPEYNVIWDISGLSQALSICGTLDFPIVPHLYLNFGFKTLDFGKHTVTTIRYIGGSYYNYDIEHSMVFKESRVGLKGKKTIRDFTFYGSFMLLFGNYTYSLTTYSYNEILARSTNGSAIEIGLNYPLYKKLFIDVNFTYSKHNLYDRIKSSEVKSTFYELGAGLYYQL